MLVSPRLSLERHTVLLAESAWWQFFIAGKNKTYLYIYVKCPTFLPNFKQIWIFLTDFFLWNPNIEFHRNLSSESSAFHVDRQTDGRRDGQMAVMEQKCVSQNYVKAPKRKELKYIVAVLKRVFWKKTKLTGKLNNCKDWKIN